MDLSELAYMPEPSAQDRMRALAAALSGQQAMGMLGQLTGDRVLAPFGASLAGNAQHQQDALNEMPQMRLKMALEELQRRKGQQEQDALNHPATGNFLRQAMAKYGQQVPKDVPASVLQHNLPVVEKGFAAGEATEARKQQGQALLAYRDQIRQEREGNELDKRFTQFGQELDPTKARGGEMGKVVNSLTQYGKVRQLLQQSPNPTPNQMYEIGRAFDRAVSGGSATEGGTQHLIPKTALGDVKAFQQWLTNTPVGAGQQDFAKLILESVDREEKYGQGLLRDWQGKKAARFSDLAKHDPARFSAELQNWGLSPEEFDPATWAYKGQPAVPAKTPNASGAPVQIKNDAEFDALPSGTQFIGPDGKTRKKP